MSKPLTSITIDQIKPDPTRRLEIRDGGARGLLLLVHPSGRKTWIMRFRNHGKMTKYTIGPWPALTLAAARLAAADVALKRSRGVDPIGEKAREKAASRAAEATNLAASYAVLAREFITDYAKKKLRRWRETARLLGFRPEGAGLSPLEEGLVTRWAARPVNEISGKDIQAVLKETRLRAPPGLKRGRSPETDSEGMSGAMFGTLSKFFNWCIGQQLIDRSPMVGLKRPSAPPARARILDDEEIRAFWVATARLAHPSGAALRLLLLTGQRLREIAELQLSEIAADGKTISLAAGRTKNHRAHFVPLAPMARAEIAEVPRTAGSAYVFSTNGRTPVSGWSKVKRRLDALMAAELGHVPAPWRLHDLRRTCASTLARIGVLEGVTEKLLNHAGGRVSGGITAVYQRYDYDKERRDALERYERWLRGLLEGTAGDNVVQLNIFA